MPSLKREAINHYAHRAFRIVVGSLGGSVRGMAIGRRTDPEPGQHFRQNSTVWEVVQIRSIRQTPHVEIAKVDDPTERKLISVAAMLDGYELVPKE